MSGSASAARRPDRRAQPGLVGPLRERFFAALAADFNTPGALAAVFDWVREANRRTGEPSATRICARCSTCSGWPTCRSRAGGGAG